MGSRAAETGGRNSEVAGRGGPKGASWSGAVDQLREMRGGELLDRSLKWWNDSLLVGMKPRLCIHSSIDSLSYMMRLISEIASLF